MRFCSKNGIAVAVFLGFLFPVGSATQAQNNTPPTGLPLGGAGLGGGTGLAGLRPGPNFPVTFEVQIDAMAIIDDWRAAQEKSQMETPRRSGVSINGTRVGSGAGNREVLFACYGTAFLDLTLGIAQPDGSILYDDGPSEGCEPRQALMLTQDRLACNWYSPRPGRPGASAPGSPIFLATVPPLAIVGECITAAAQVEPAIVLPEGRMAGRNVGGAGTRTLRGAGCGGSGVTVNGRATGQSANCRR